MKDFIAASLLVVSASGLYAQGETSHEWSTKFFFKDHKESNYTFKSYGSGISYDLKRDEGINFSLESLRNFDLSKPYYESNSTIFYRFQLRDGHELFPIFSSKVTLHHYDKNDSADIFVNKNTGFMGIGWNFSPDESFTFSLHSLLFKDIVNSLHFVEKEYYYGQTYDNPYGFKIKMGISSQISSSFFFNLETDYTKTFKDIYRTFGIACSIKWRF